MPVKEGIGCPESGVTSACEPPSVFWDPSLCQVLSAAPSQGFRFVLEAGFHSVAWAGLELTV